FLRIWPLYYMGLLVLLVLLPTVLPSVPPQLQGMRDKQAWFWLYAANWLFAREGSFGHTSGAYLWPLAVEEQFHIVWPLVVGGLRPRGSPHRRWGCLHVEQADGYVRVHLRGRLVRSPAGLGTERPRNNRHLTLLHNAFHAPDRQVQLRAVRGSCPRSQCNIPRCHPCAGRSRACHRP